jgi:hypothetical protein
VFREIAPPGANRERPHWVDFRRLPLSISVRPVLLLAPRDDRQRVVGKRPLERERGGVALNVPSNLTRPNPPNRLTSAKAQRFDHTWLSRGVAPTLLARRVISVPTPASVPSKSPEQEDYYYDDQKRIRVHCRTLRSFVAFRGILLPPRV